MTTNDAYLAAARTAVTLLGDPAVAAGWAAPSALPEFGVAGLAGHLARQLFSVPEVLAAQRPADDAGPIPLADHYARSAWRDAALDDDVNVGIRRHGEALAGDGPAALAARAAATLAELTDALPAVDPQRPVFLPWGPWSLRVDDFLVTRMMEIAVHGDDLAVSVGIATPQLPEAVLEPVLALLTALAVRRHGQPAVLRALARAERAPASIAAF
jgi:hypothetical protein